MKLLDFTDYIGNEYFLAFKEYEGKDVYVLSKHLQIYTSESGKPNFLFEIVRGVTPYSKPSPYALLEMQFEPSILHESALNTISNKWPGHQVKYAEINSGYLMLNIYNNDEHDEDTGCESKFTIPLSKMPLSRFRIVEQFSEGSINLFQSVLEKGVLLMSAKGWYSVSGYTPRVNSVVKFNPAELTNSVKSFISNSQSEINYEKLFFLFRDKINLLPIQITNYEKGESFASSLTARFLEYFCEPKANLNESNDIIFNFNELSTKEGEFNWDLHNPQVAKYYISFSLQGIESMLKMISEGNFPEYTQTRIVESLPTGFTPISVYHPFNMLPVGIRQVGVKISAAPVENHRLQAINETITFDSGTAKITVILKFSPHEKFEFDVLPFVIVEDNGVTYEIHGDRFTSNSNILFIQENQFPLHIITFNCTEALIDAADIKLEIASDNEKTPLPSTSFSKEQSTVMYAFSKEHIKKWKAVVTAVDNKFVNNNEVIMKTVSKSFDLNYDLKIDFTSFDSFGSHAVNIKLKEENDGLTAIELLPENLEELNENITTIALSKNKPEQTWQWYTSSLFKSGFRYRLPLSDNEWSEVLSYDLNELIIP